MELVDLRDILVDWADKRAKMVSKAIGKRKTKKVLMVLEPMFQLIDSKYRLNISL